MNPKTRFTIAGDGDDALAIKNHCQKLGLEKHITWHGRFSPNEIPSLIQTASVIIDPIDASLVSRAKSSFRVTLAIATGHAVVTSNIGIRSKLIPSNFHQKFFAQPEHAKDYANKINTLLQTSLTNKEAQDLQAHGKNYTWTQLAAQYQRILQSL